MLVPRREKTLVVTHESFILGFQLVTTERKGVKPALLGAQETTTNGFDALQKKLVQV